MFNYLNSMSHDNSPPGEWDRNIKPTAWWVYVIFWVPVIIALPFALALLLVVCAVGLVFYIVAWLLFGSI